MYDMRHVLGARFGESRSPVLSLGSKGPRRETVPAAMGHPSWGSSMGFTYILSIFVFVSVYRSAKNIS